MSLSNQQVVEGRIGIAVYVSGESLAPAETITLLQINASSLPVAGLSLGIGVDDPTAYGNGLVFDIVINGKLVMSIDDEICTLLQKEFLPMDIPNNATIELKCINATAAAVLVAAFMRVEVL